MAEEADAYDRCIGEKGRVRVGPSHICNGVGVFAVQACPKGTVMTAYPFVRQGHRKVVRQGRRNNDYAFQRSDGTAIDGHPQVLSKATFYLKRRKRGDHHMWGVANLANDAIHPELTGRTNNCDFVEMGSRVYLATSQAVAAGEELLVAYSLSYWMDRAQNEAWTPQMREWLGYQVRVRDALRPLHVELDEYLGVLENEEEMRLKYIATYACACCAHRRHVGRLMVRWHPTMEKTMIATCMACKTLV
jgi:hypothetical protein